ncbi:MAG: energy transducer TonB [Thermoanaerobaculia bacterium]
MAKRDDETLQQQSSNAGDDEFALGEWGDFAREEAEERRIRKVAIAAAVALHLAVAGFWWVFGALPTIGREIEQEKKVYVVQQVRFQPPPPPQEQEIPPPKTKKVPIPDPTPDEPEPIVDPEELQPEIDLPDTDLIFGMPDAPPAEPQGPIMVGGDVQAPVKLSGAEPTYTEIARRARIEGVVIVQAIVNKEGVVENVKILKGLPMGLDQSAVDAVKRWRFEPATLHGKPVDVYYTLTVNFQLN